MIITITTVIILSVDIIVIITVTTMIIGKPSLTIILLRGCGARPTSVASSHLVLTAAPLPLCSLLA